VTEFVGLERVFLLLIAFLVLVEFLHIGYLVAKIRRTTVVISAQLEKLTDQLAQAAPPAAGTLGGMSIR
jgi:hypothetical protein